MNIRISHTQDGTVLRFVSVGDYEVLDSHCLFNGGPGVYPDKLWAISAPLGNFSRTMTIVWGDIESNGLDVAADAGLLDRYLVEYPDPERLDAGEYLHLGNAGEPFDLQDARIDEIPPEVWQADWEFVYAIGRAQENPDIETAADL
jgi:hypothetical protein